MKSLTGKLSSARGWALLLVLFVGAGLFVAACGDEETPAPTTPAPAPPAPPPAPEPEPEPPAVPTGLEISASGLDFVEWRWSAVEGVSGYDVQFSTNEAFTDEDEVIARTAEQISYRRTDLTAETSYYLRVRSAAGTGDGRVTSGWSTHVTGMTTAATPARPPAPTNVRVTGETATTITWSWNAVDGAAGYQVQHSDSATIADDAPTAFASTTTYTVSNLASRTDRHLRVRAYSGTISEPVYGGWSATVEGTTDRAPAPVTTALSAPTGLSTGSLTSSSITVRWNDVDDVDEYEVQQQPADGSWTGASCGGGDARVTDEACVASDLERGTRYSFRVRAHPDPDDETRTVSVWSSTTAAETSGPAPREPVAGGGDELNITWESDATSITWFWSAADDNRITNLYVVLTPASAGARRQACPALNDTTNAWQTDKPYARAHEVTGLTAGGGDVRGLCVRRTWTDDQGNPQYGPVSVAWAAASPAQPSNTPGTGEIMAGPKDDSKTLKTSAIDWFVQMDKGFKYQVRTVSAQVGESLGTCADEGVGNTEMSASSDNAHERFRLSSLQAYTAYKACVRATNDQGYSGWTEIGTEIHTLPTAPPGLGSSADFTTATGAVSGTITWSFGSSATTPEQPNGYQAVAFHNGTSAQARAQSSATPLPAVVGLDCANTNSGNVIAAPTIRETGSGFEFDTAPLSFTRASTTERAYSVTVLACVRAKIADAQRGGTAAGTYGPWRSATRTVSVPRQTQ